MKITIFCLFYFLSYSIFAYSESIVDHITSYYSIPQDYIQNIISKSSIDNTVIKLINNQKEKLPFSAYKKIFINTKRIKKGKEYIKKHSYWLKRASKQFDVDYKIITSIIGIESLYGQHKPQFKAINSLYTLATKFERRKSYFTYELASFLYYTYKENINPFSINSSYAGAIGIPQFMPSNILKFGIDFNKNGKINLIKEHPDAIGSVANYLRHYGFKKNKPTAIKIKIINKRKIKLNTPVRYSNIKKHIYSPFKVKNSYIVKVIKVEKDYWLTFKNFEALLKYNNSINYALTVLLLSKKIG
ncbi:lytic murein transglycosylase [Deferribacter thermophilus]|uniref:lytic murein transglycosylase n=1 Tax=Deferribacter thermophilus TaxID=53573 RepID=UPI003C299CD3